MSDMIEDVEEIEDDEELQMIEEELNVNVYPLIDELDEHSPGFAWFITFCEALDMMFEAGWTKEEVLAHIQDQHELYLQDAVPEGQTIH